MGKKITKKVFKLPEGHIPLEEKVSVERRYYVTLNGWRMTYAYFNWLPSSQGMGWKSLQGCKKYRIKCRAKMPKEDRGEWGIVKVYYVCIDKSPVGSMHDFGQGPHKGNGRRKLMLEFPKELSPQLGGMRKKKALLAMKKFLLYVADVKTVKPRLRAGSSKWW